MYTEIGTFIWWDRDVRAGRAQPIQYIDLTYLDTYLSLPILVPGELGNPRLFQSTLCMNVPLVKRRALINITPKVEACLKESRIKEDLALINAMHITTSVFINDDESVFHHDFEVWLEKLAPHEPVNSIATMLRGQCRCPFETAGDG
jgi:hypothetical protein